MEKPITIDENIPLIGVIQFGCIDRGTNLIQIRATTACNLNCVFCSTDAGAYSRFHKVNYLVELDHLINWVKEIVKFKKDVIAFIDSVGETLTYPKIVELVKELKKIKEIKKIIIVTNGVLLTKKLFDSLKKAGLDQINISINALDDNLSKKLSGTEKYDINNLLNTLRYISNSGIKLIIAPVWIPNLNNNEIPKLIKLAKELNCETGIQKYETYRYSRKAKNAKKITYWKFYKQLREWENEFKIKLIYKAKDLGIEKRERFPTTFKTGEMVNVKIVLPGWITGELIGMAKNRCISVLNCKADIGSYIKVKILTNKNNIYIAE